MPGAGVKILNKRIRSVKSTQQITKAMKMVAAAKLNRSQGKMLAARPYARKLVKLVQGRPTTPTRCSSSARCRRAFTW